MIRISAFSDELSPCLDEQIAWLVNHQVKWMEIRFVDERNITTFTEEEAQEIRHKLDEAGIGVSAVASPIGKYPIDAPFEPHFELFKHTVRLAQVLGAPFVRIFSFYPPEGCCIEEYEEQVLARMRQMASWAEAEGVRLAHENEAHIFGHTAKNCATLMREVASTAMVQAYDPANYVWGEGITDNMCSCWPLVAPYVEHIHIKDWKLGSTEIGSLAGDGDGQIDLLFAAMAERRYSGFVTLEPHLSEGGQFGGHTSPEQFAATLERVRNFCTKYDLPFE